MFVASMCVNSLGRGYRYDRASTGCVPGLGPQLLQPPRRV